MSIPFGLAISLALGFCFFAAASGRPAAALEPASAAAQAGNLIKNPGFEGAYHAWSSIPEVQVAANWTPWWWEDPNHNPAYFRPEYKRALASVFPKRVLSGESAQQWFTFHASHVAGMYQQVFDVTPGQRYRFSIWAQVWSSSEDNPHQSLLPANPHLQIGIDPTGNWNPGAPTVLWSGEAPMSGVIDQWGLMVLEATAENNVITVFMRTNPDFANKHNDMYWDNAGLEAVQPPQPTTPPSPTPGPVTNTPVATFTVEFSPTAAATSTPEATATETMPPTPTSTPTVVPVTATRTATPSATSTVTASPTHTRQSTATAVPTETSEASPTPSRDALAENGQVNAGTPDLAADQQLEERPEADNWELIALIAIGVSVGLLLVLIYVLTRGLGQERS